MKIITLFFVLIISSFSFANLSCQSNVQKQKPSFVSKYENNFSGDTILHSSQNTVESRFIPPNEYNRLDVSENSFGAFLRYLPLKEKGSKVNYYTSETKSNYGIYVGVIDLPIGDKNLHQCADAVMRLRAEYLFAQKKYQEIHFNALFDGKPKYFTDFAKGNFSYEKFWKYLENVFTNSNTTSLYDELIPVHSIRDVEIGDVFIEKKQPYGHAAIVVDIAVNHSGEKIFLLAQSYMPAQEIQVLDNRVDRSIAPWFRSVNNIIETPEWIFSVNHLRRFKN